MRPKKLFHVCKRLFDEYWREWQAIDRRYPLLTGDAPEGVGLSDHIDTLGMMREAARSELREAIQQAATETTEEDLGSEVYVLTV